jgi:PHD/YefM family antitoxin component YafN of YafNO toxin-antitoxin module
MRNNSDKKHESEEETDRRLNQEATMEKLKTPNKDIKNLKTLEEILKEKR